MPQRVSDAVLRNHLLSGLADLAWGFNPGGGQSMVGYSEEKWVRQIAGRYEF